MRIGFPILIRVLGSGVGNANDQCGQDILSRGDLNVASEPFEIRGRSELIPHFHLVAPRGNIRDLEISAGIGLCEIRRLQSNNNGAHLRMNIAEDVGDSFAREDDATGRACFVESKVKASAVEE